MRLTYTVQVCNESREIFSLLNFLIRTVDTEDEINVVVDSAHTTDRVSSVLDNFKDRVNVYERPFDNFKANSDFHIQMATGDYIFGMDADEIPQYALVKNVKRII
jgi:hypothetical protein